MLKITEDLARIGPWDQDPPRILENIEDMADNDRRYRILYGAIGSPKVREVFRDFSGFFLILFQRNGRSESVICAGSTRA